MTLGYEDWSKSVLGRSRRVRAKDWEAPRALMHRTDKELGACKGWILGVSVGDPSVDQPCIVFLTDHVLYVDVRPQTLANPELIVAPFHMIAKCGIGRNDVGGTRLICIIDATGKQDPDDARAIGVDLPRGRHGAAFGKLVVDTVGATEPTG